MLAYYSSKSIFSFALLQRNMPNMKDKAVWRHQVITSPISSYMFSGWPSSSFKATASDVLIDLDQILPQAAPASRASTPPTKEAPFRGIAGS